MCNASKETRASGKERDREGGRKSEPVTRNKERRVGRNDKEEAREKERAREDTEESRQGEGW